MDNKTVCRQCVQYARVYGVYGVCVYRCVGIWCMGVCVWVHGGMGAVTNKCVKNN